MSIVCRCPIIIVRTVMSDCNYGGRCLLLPMGLEVKLVNEMSGDGPGVADLEGLIEQINAALEQGDWAQVVALTIPLHECASAMGEIQLADLVQDLHWIANDALVNPL